MENIDKKFTLIGEHGAKEQEKIAKPALSFFQDAWRRLRLNKVAVVSMWVLIVTILFAVGSTFFVSQSDANAFNPNKTEVYKNLPPKLGNLDIPGWNGVFTPPGSGSKVNVYQSQNVPKGKSYILGTDQFGRSIAKRVIIGLRISLIIAFAATLLDLLIGVSYGIVSGWIGGKVDTFMQRIIEIVMAIPYIIIVTMLSLWIGQGLWALILAMGLFSWMSMARQIRNMVLSYKERDFVLAARTLGESSFKIAMKHLIPNMSGVIIVQVMLTIPSMIFTEATLSMISLGVKPPTASLGTLISDGMTTLQFYPWQLGVPAVVLALLALAFVLFGDGLRDAFDPRASED